jgi:hypothetical protein
MADERVTAVVNCERFKSSGAQDCDHPTRIPVAAGFGEPAGRRGPTCVGALARSVERMDVVRLGTANCLFHLAVIAFDCGNRRYDSCAPVRNLAHLDCGEGASRAGNQGHAILAARHDSVCRRRIGSAVLCLEGDYVRGRSVSHHRFRPRLLLRGSLAVCDPPGKGEITWTGVIVSQYGLGRH